ncbi:MAG: hypothetical protein JOZ49_14955 [Mycolicibacterium sp.]|nr:hypothetical protein [Mycolicibacterium sp.]
MPLSSSIAAARLPAVVAIVVALLAILVIRRLRTSTDERPARRASGER